MPKKLGKKAFTKLLNREEISLFKSLNTPQKIQDYLEEMPFNFENGGETYLSPREILKRGEAHCFEAALLALAILSFHGREVFLLDLKTSDIKNDADHAIAIFTEGKGKEKRWGAISKTNHSVLRWRDPIYLSPRELASSYFHEYFLEDGRKTLKSFSEPFDVIKKFGLDWLILDEDLDEIALALDRAKHYNFYHSANRKFIRKASSFEVACTVRPQFKNKSK